MQTIFDKYLKPKRGKIYFCFVGLEKAFDSVNSSKLWFKQSSIGIGKPFVHNLMNIYSESRLCIRLGKLSKEYNANQRFKLRFAYDDHRQRRSPGDCETLRLSSRGGLPCRR